MTVEQEILTVPVPPTGEHGVHVRPILVLCDVDSLHLVPVHLVAKKRFDELPLDTLLVFGRRAIGDILPEERSHFLRVSLDPCVYLLGHYRVCVA